MNPKHVFLSFVLLCFFVGCKGGKNKTSNGEVVSTEKLKKSLLEGEWSLIQSIGGFAGINEKITKGEVEWDFNPEDSTVVINNNFRKPGAYTGRKTGTYDYSISTIENKNYLSIDGRELGAFEIEGDRLTIDENDISRGKAFDRFVLFFER